MLEHFDWNAVFAGYRLAPEARMDGIVEDAGRALRFVHEHLEEFGFARRPLVIETSVDGKTYDGTTAASIRSYGTLAGLFYVRRWHLPVRPMLDAVAPAMTEATAGCDRSHANAASRTPAPRW